VQDTGIGIAEEEMVHLFEAFERAPTAKHMGIEGTGLGLPISLYLVEAHGGQMMVESTVQQGSTFMFTLPLHPVIDKRMTITEAIAIKLGE
jgi:two-component system, OmpR family, sensor histidine kinase ResE